MFDIISKYVVNQIHWFFCDPYWKSYMKNEIVR